MGYYTYYKGGVSGPSELLDVFEADAKSGKTYGQYKAKLDDWTYGEFFGGDTAKWYDWEDDMRSLSEVYPHLLFHLEGEGEEAGDMWKAWARNGKVIVVHARIVFDEPDLATELPTPDVTAELARIRAIKRKQIDDKIAELQQMRDDLDE